MSTLQIQVAKSLEGLSDDNLKFLLEMINRFMKPTTDVNIRAQENKSFRPLGMYKHEQFCADGYDMMRTSLDLVGNNPRRLPAILIQIHPFP